MSDKIVYITFRDYEELKEYTRSRYVAPTGEILIIVTLKSINYNEEYDNQRRVLKSVDKSKLIFEMNLPNDDTLVEDPVIGYTVVLQSIYPTIVPKTFFAKSTIPEKKEPTNNLNETFTFVNGVGFKNKKYNSSILFDVLALYPKKETKMTKIKDIKLNGPATILFTTDNKKVVVKCRPGDDYDPEKGILMVLCKYIHNSNNWTEVFDIPYKDEIDVEKVIAMFIVKDCFYRNDKDWHYNYVLKYMYNAVNLKTEDRVKALKALDYSVERIARCLGITKGLVKDILQTKNKTVWETAKENLLSYLDGLKKVNNSTNEVTDHKPCDMKEKDVITDQNIIDLFNKGYSISKISKELGLTEYFVKKYLDAYTNPKTEKKADKILRKAVKSSKKENKPRGGYHKRLTEITFPSYLTEEESQDILEKTKVKYEGKYKRMSELQKYFIRECKHFAINKFYGNGYSAFELGQMLGVSAAAIMRMRNNPV